VTVQTDPRDEQWTRALSGSPDPEADAHINREAELVRRALEVRRNSLDHTVPAADESLYQQVEARLHREGVPRAHSSRWKSMLALAATAFALGLLVARVTMIPAAPAMRSPTPAMQTVVVRVENPGQIVQEASREAIGLGLALSVTSTGASYHVSISGLVPESPGQRPLKEALGLSPSAAGAILVIVQKK
jgi:hypothetical protein